MLLWLQQQRKRAPARTRQCQVIGSSRRSCNAEPAQDVIISDVIRNLLGTLLELLLYSCSSKQLLRQLPEALA